MRPLGGGLKRKQASGTGASISHCSAWISVMLLPQFPLSPSMMDCDPETDFPPLSCLCIFFLMETEMEQNRPQRHNLEIGLLLLVKMKSHVLDGP